MSRVALSIFIVFTFITGCVIHVVTETASEAYQPKNHTHTGWIHNGCVEFRDPETIVSRGLISRIEVAHGNFIHGIRLHYGRDGQGGFHLGLPENELSKWNIRRSSWTVPEGEIIARIEGDINHHYISRLQFFTDRGTASPQFGGKTGRHFSVNEMDSGGLRTISGHVNKRRHKSLNRAVASMTFHFGPPCYIKEIRYDLDALKAARPKATPKTLAYQEIPNGTSVEQTVLYEKSETIKTSKTLTFQQSLGFKMASEISAGLPGGIGSSVSFEFSGSTSSGRSYENTATQAVSWSVPVKVPPGKKILVVSTVKRYEATVPFTYTVAWYWGTKDNIIREATLPGAYEGVHVEDLKHDFREVPLE